MAKCAVLIPAFNEERTVGKVIEAVRKANGDCSVLVGDNNSTDRTANEVLKRGVIPIPVWRRGKGYVIRQLLSAVREDYVVMVDADNTYPIEWYLRPIEKLLADYDVVICHRQRKEPSSMSMLNRIGNWCMSWFASVLYGYRVRDVCSGLWGFRKSALDKFHILSGSGVALECELFALAVKNGCSISQLPIVYRARPNGSKVKVNVFMDGLRDVWMLLRRRFV